MSVATVDTLEKRAYDVYVEGLSVNKKRKLIARLQSDIDKAYKDWGEIMVEFITQNTIALKALFKIYDRFTGYGVAEKRGVLSFDYHRECVAYYVLNGKLAATVWDDMGSPSRITSEKIQQNRDTNKDLDGVLAAFVATHPELQ